MSATSGHSDGMQHFFPIRVYYEDTDAGGIVYHAQYLNYAERARTELLRLAGVQQSAMTAEHEVNFAVRSCSVEFFKPARFDDLLEVRSRLTRLGGASLTVEQSIWRGAEELVRCALKIATMASDGRPRRIPAAVRALLTPYTPESNPQQQR